MTTWDRSQTIRFNADGNSVYIFITDLAVKVSGSESWINAQ